MNRTGEAAGFDDCYAVSSRGVSDESNESGEHKSISGELTEYHPALRSRGTPQPLRFEWNREKRGKG